MNNTQNRHRQRARATAGIVVALALATSPTPRTAQAQAAKPVVHVFLPIDAKSSVIEKALQDHLPDVGVTVFGRYRDFEDGLASGKPDAVLSFAPVLAQHGKKVSLQGQRGGKGAEAYVLASVNATIEGSLAGKTVGVVDTMGRDGTQTFVNTLTKESGVKLKRVAKVEDLLPLLEFNTAEGIILPSSMLARLIERTKLVIKSRELPGGPVGLPAVAILNPTGKDTITKAFQNLDAGTKKLLGIDSWSAQ